ncbi:MAG: gliding motility protein [Polyangiaceae bacterium]|nr:gliding motility protein [Polyangiaceae bacterium]
MSVQLDFATKEMTIKLVYYGPALSGKTTNLQALHAAASGDSKGRLMTLDTRDDRTLFFDLLPLSFEDASGLKVRLKVFTVPGQVIHSSTRRLVVQGADGVAFIADSRVAETETNAESFVDLRDNLEAHGMLLGEMPLVIQFNKRDLPAVRPKDEVAEMAQAGREPVYLAIATQGDGVVETFLALLYQTWKRLEKEHTLSEKFGFDGRAFIANVAEKLGFQGSIEDVLAHAVGATSLGEVGE